MSREKKTNENPGSEKPGLQQKVKQPPASIWEEVISDVTKSTGTPESHILIFGNKSCGKRSLLTSLQQRLEKSEVNKKTIKLSKETRIGSSFAMMDYGYLYVKDTSDMDKAALMQKQSYLKQSLESEEHVSLLHTWVLDDPQNKEYLKKVFRPEYLLKCAAVICLSSEEPWKMMSDLESWIGVIMQILEEHMKDLPLEQQDKIRNEVVSTIKNYEVPQLDEKGNVINTKARQTEEEKNLKSEIPLGEGVLKVNIGIPLIILCTKSDFISSKDSGLYNDQKLELLYKSLRTQALLYGATLIFISEKTETNLDLFYHYLMHRLYGFPFKFQPIVDEKEKVFIPSGFDSIKLITEMAKNVQTLVFEDAFVEPPSKKPPPKQEVICEDFSLMLNQYLAKKSILPNAAQMGHSAGLPLPNQAKSVFVTPPIIDKKKPEKKEDAKDAKASAASKPNEEKNKSSVFWNQLKSNPSPAPRESAAMAGKKSVIVPPRKTETKEQNETPEENSTAQEVIVGKGKDEGEVKGGK